MSLLSLNKNTSPWLQSKTGGAGRYFIECRREREGDELVCFAKLDPNATYAMIRARGEVHYYVIKGVLIIREQRYEEGAWLRIDSEEEFTPSTNQAGCEVLCFYTRGFDKLADTHQS